MSTLEIVTWEDRSGTGTPSPDSFGYVYFNDGSRVGYSPDVADHDDVWEPSTNGAGEYIPVTSRHLELARDFLREQGVLS